MSDNSEFIKSIENATMQIIMQESKKMEKACLVIETQAKQECPVDMGNLRASIVSETEISVNEITGRIGSNEGYAPYVHNGTGIYAINGDGRKTPWTYVVKAGKYKGGHFTVGQKPNQFLEHAKLSNKDRVLKILGD